MTGTSPATDSVYGLLIDAAHEDGGPAPDREHLLVLVPAETRAEAECEALIALQELSWKDCILKRVEAFRAPLDTIEDPNLRLAAINAFAGRRSVMVYPRP